MQNPGTTQEEPVRRFRLVLADDHREVREELRQLLEPEFDVLCEVGEGAALVQAVFELKADAAVTDIHMPNMDGIEAGRQIIDRGLCEAVVALTMYSDPHLVQSAFDAGIRGYVLKVDASEELIPAIYAALKGKRYLSLGVRPNE
jgi:DNA-binding NarL/FixJ family response regulator